MNASSAAGFMLTRDGDDAPVLMLPLFSPDKRTVHAVAIVALSEPVTASDPQSHTYLPEVTRSSRRSACPFRWRWSGR